MISWKCLCLALTYKFVQTHTFLIFVLIQKKVTCCWQLSPRAIYLLSSLYICPLGGACLVLYFHLFLSSYSDLPAYKWCSFEGTRTQLKVWLLVEELLLELVIVELLEKKLLDLKMKLKLAGREEHGRGSDLLILISSLLMSGHKLSVNASRVEGRKDGEGRRGRTDSPSVFLEKCRNGLKSLVCYNCMAVIIYHFVYLSVLFI